MKSPASRVLNNLSHNIKYPNYTHQHGICMNAFNFFEYQI